MATGALELKRKKKKKKFSHVINAPIYDRSLYDWVSRNASQSYIEVLVYLDLKKAFDKVPHRRLIWKLNHVWEDQYWIGFKIF